MLDSDKLADLGRPRQHPRRTAARVTSDAISLSSYGHFEVKLNAN